MSWSPTGPADEHAGLVEGLATIATSLAEMGTTDSDARAQLLKWIARLGVDVATIRDAARAISTMPQPLEETAEKTERMQPIREMLGVRSPSDQLVAALRAREWLEQLAAEATT